MTGRERVVVSASVLLNPLADRDVVAANLNRLVQVVGWILPSRADIVVDLTGLQLGDDALWWLNWLADQGIPLIAASPMPPHGRPSIRQVWVVAHDFAAIATPHADRVREIIVQPDCSPEWDEIEYVLREYAALIAGR